MRINLGPAGTPASSTIEGLSAVRKLGLKTMEVQFSHGLCPDCLEKYYSSQMEDTESDS